MPKIRINKLHSIESNRANTILETMEQAGLQPEYNCRDGHCGACRCKLESGEVEYVGFAMAYTQGNEILPCICRAKTDVILSEVNYVLKEKRA
ncbi:class I ribonucleotide reductase maintenance protein YfaE [Vibrio vulnificus]|uniref:class I ribonucleotide reductase maintenance protein YfaE n=1 Tax=Vibrio vulnificus TaxID=672 RepID=UPI00076B0C92|nr:class I ribonucleotide reductase maintenance protein YfaE [Vibrio vulnificus]AMG11747.1 (2Fe-2S)-binding protein [Vibrio vulnificus]EGR0235479.1 2Fe-2S iron-sulfur cluster binding domain-containing protein [Vibrio vulnificus]EGR1868399.1 2Fe-2S iron-sulfur cluster binding domain-containing protein [Vibrio vulnificus]EJE8692951.1 2Fe-2S iron-sulfur cluster binding domain-containing protein [Vibrio vulnificus]ELF4907202.1 2Fe-2S iron-sulfur cluster binding domain-containing protein [Vibrio vu